MVSALDCFPSCRTASSPSPDCLPQVRTVFELTTGKPMPHLEFEAVSQSDQNPIGQRVGVVLSIWFSGQPAVWSTAQSMGNGAAPQGRVPKGCVLPLPFAPLLPARCAAFRASRRPRWWCPASRVRSQGASPRTAKSKRRTTDLELTTPPPKPSPQNRPNPAQNCLKKRLKHAPCPLSRQAGARCASPWSTASPTRGSCWTR